MSLKMKTKIKLKDSIVQFMTDRHIIDDVLTSEIPTSYEKFGNLVLFNYPSFSNSKWNEIGDDLWRLICSILRCENIAVKKPITGDNYRSPRINLIYGQTPIAYFVDNGIKYSWNIEKTMFSRGNLSERHRIANLDCSNEVVVDLFAGIGYFTLPYLVHAKAKHVHACEWNPDAIEFLRYNLQKNRVADRCTIYEGDNRLVCPKKIAHRVNLGLLPSSEVSWETACRALVPSGGTLYVHQNVDSTVPSSSKNLHQCDECKHITAISSPSESNLILPVKVFSTSTNADSIYEDSNVTIVWKRVEWFLFSIHLSHKILKFCEIHHEGRWNVSVDEVFKIKSYAPHVDHIVFGVKCIPCFHMH